MKIKLLFLAMLFSFVAFGQFNIASGGTNYTQDFNTLTNGVWTDGTTLSGWYAKTTATASISTYGANTGTTLTASLYAFGVLGTNALSDRGLGYAPSNSFTGNVATGKGYLGWRLKNNTGFPISSITVTWSGEQWRRNDVTAETLNLFYQTGVTVTDLTNGTWTTAPSSFTSPQLSNTGLALDGNTPANRTSNILVTIPVSVPVGQEIMLRWEDANDPSNDNFMAIDDVTVNATVITCTPTPLTTVTPVTGPIGTEVSINAASGLSGATATFNGIVATVVSNSATQLVVKIPAGATTGNLIVTNAALCASLPIAYTIIDEDVTSCESTGVASSDLIIYEVDDEFTGTGGTITLYNNTATTKTLSNYRIFRTSNQGDNNEVNYATLSGTIAAGALGIIKVNGTDCGPVSSNGTITLGFNAFDGIQLRSSDLVTVIDNVYAPNNIGYYMKRNAGAFTPRTSFVATDWSIITLAAGVCATGLGTSPTGLPATIPSITAQPTISLTCSSTTAVLTVDATEGFVGGNPLAYQWFAVAPNATNWTALSNGIPYSGVNTNSLSISSVTGLNGYQFYCQVRENLATCYLATVAVKLIIGASTSDWNGTTWDNGAPTLVTLATISGDYDMSLATLPSIDACSLSINSGTVTVSSGKYINIQNDLSIASGTTLTVLDKGSLVQVNDAGTNTINGTFNMTRLADIRKYDYVFWSSPVLNFPLNTLSSGTNSAYVWNWNTTVANPNGGFGNWENTLENMVTGKGYIVRGSDTFSNATTQTFTANFTGTPHNGVYTPTISRENYQGVNYLGTNLATITNNDDNWNLIGNPYPSAIKAMDFITVNTNIDGNVRLWTHGTLPSSAITSPYYNSYTNNYSPNDYIVYNGTATTSGPTGFNGYIAAGQSFLVLMNDGAATTETVTFNNSMRKTTNNNQFYKQSNLKNNLERHRIWLDLVSSTGVANRTVVGYIEGATQQKDRLFDAYTNIGGTQDFYSLIDNKTMVIQGRALPFSPDDMVPMGIVVPNNGTYTISIANVDGLFATNFQNIYLEDKQLNIIYDLKTAPYSFTANAGTFNNRFQLRYTNTKLKNTEFNSTDNQVVITSNNQEILIISAIEKISSVSVFDVLGRKILSLENINDTNAKIEKSKFATEVLVLKIKLENGEVITKKVL